MGLLDLLSEKMTKPAECIVTVAGEEVADFYSALVEVKVEVDRNQATTASLVLETRRLEDGDWSVQDDERFKPWETIKIEAQFGNETEEVMSGYIKEIKADFPAEKGAARVTIACQDHSLQLDREHIEQRWGEDAPTTDGFIASEIARRNNLGLLAPPSEGQTVQDLNQNTTDIKFLQRRAQANGFEIIFQQSNVYFGEMRLNADTQSTIKVYAGTDTNCVDFSLSDDGHLPDRVAYQAAAQTGTQAPPVELEPNLQSLGNEPVTSENSGLNPFVWRVQRQGINDSAQLDAIAQQMANQKSMKIAAQGQLDGSLYGHVLRVGEPVGVDGVGQRYSGTYYVDAVTHVFDVNGYKVNFKLLRNAYGDNLNDSTSILAGVL